MKKDFVRAKIFGLIIIMAFLTKGKADSKTQDNTICCEVSSLASDIFSEENVVHPIMECNPESNLCGSDFFFSKVRDLPAYYRMQLMEQGYDYTDDLMAIDRFSLNIRNSVDLSWLHQTSVKYLFLTFEEPIEKETLDQLSDLETLLGLTISFSEVRDFETKEECEEAMDNYFYAYPVSSTKMWVPQNVNITNDLFSFTSTCPNLEDVHLRYYHCNKNTELDWLKNIEKLKLLELCFGFEETCSFYDYFSILQSLNLEFTDLQDESEETSLHAMQAIEMIQTLYTPSKVFHLKNNKSYLIFEYGENEWMSIDESYLEAFQTIFSQYSFKRIYITGKGYCANSIPIVNSLSSQDIPDIQYENSVLKYDATEKTIFVKEGNSQFIFDSLPKDVLIDLSTCSNCYTVPYHNPYAFAIPLTEEKFTFLKENYRIEISEKDEKIFHEINKKLEEMIHHLAVTEDMDEEEKFNRVLLYVCQNYKYNHEEYPNCLLEGVLDSDEIVCGNYAALVSALLTRLNIENSYLSSGIHAWNLVKLHGEYYYTDVTWVDDMEDNFAKQYALHGVNTASAIMNYDWYLKDPTTVHDKVHQAIIGSLPIEPIQNEEFKKYKSFYKQENLYLFLTQATPIVYGTSFFGLLALFQALELERKKRKEIAALGLIKK